MFWDAKNHKIKINGYETDFISFGKGDKNLIIIPGLGDGIKTVKGMAVPLAFMYRIFAKKYKVYVFSRKNNLPEVYSTREMAKDLHDAMQELGIQYADVLGVSMGGMIAQYLAIDYPISVHKLVLAVTLAKQNNTIQNSCRKWIALADAGDYTGLMLDTAKKSYTDSYLHKNRLMLGISSKIGKPGDFKRFTTMAQACMSHNAYDELYKIKCPVLVTGGKQDKIVTCRASQEIAGKIWDSRLKIYEEYGHALYEEADGFNNMVLEFLDI